MDETNGWKVKKIRILKLKIWNCHISIKVDFRAKNITRNKGYRFIIMKWSIHQMEIIILHVSTNNSILKYIKQKWIDLQRKKEIHD